jgi:ATP-dependent Clp protease adaptor protein ClpS
MPATKTKKGNRSRTVNAAMTELPWNVMLHNDGENSMPRVVVILKEVVPGMTYRRAARFMWEAHSTGQAVLKGCHKELAGLNQERLQQKGPSVSIKTGG